MGHVLIDLRGRFETVVVETVVESIDDYFQRLQAMFAAAVAMQQGPPLTTLVQSGHREYYTIEGER